MIKLKPLNEQRAERAKIALQVYVDQDIDDGQIDDPHTTDLITDLMHLLGREEFNVSLRMAEIHYVCELTGKE